MPFFRERQSLFLILVLSMGLEDLRVGLWFHGLGSTCKLENAIGSVLSVYPPQVSTTIPYSYSPVDQNFWVLGAFEFFFVNHSMTVIEADGSSS